MIVLQRRFSNIRIAETEISPCLESASGGGGGNLPMVLAVLEGNGCRPSHQGFGLSTDGKTMYTLNSTEVHGVAYELPRQDRPIDGK